MKIYLIKNEYGQYFVDGRYCWRDTKKSAKKYIDKSSMLKRIRRIKVEVGKDVKLYFETFELVSQGETEINNYLRACKLKKIQERNENNT